MQLAIPWRLKLHTEYVTAAKPDMDQVSTLFCTILPDTLLHYYCSELYAFSYPCVISERMRHLYLVNQRVQIIDLVPST